jgi:crotonobetainyl-CoA:carnitine CoA-transferase CaiB-like acyl-CoA transferase
MAQDTTENWLNRMEEAKLPAGPVNDILQMHSDPQAIDREMIVEVDHPKAGKVETIGHPVKFSRTPASIDRAAPLLGQHTREVLAEFGYDTEQIEALIRSQTVIAT